MATKTRTITTTQTYTVCDLCGLEINACGGNTLYVKGDEAKEIEPKTYYVHLMDDDGCARKLILDTVEKLVKKKK